MIPVPALRHVLAASKLLLLSTLVLGIGYPLTILLVGTALSGQANGSTVTSGGEVVGSSLLGQSADDPQWFQPRPSASEYSGEASGGTNLAASDERAQAAVAERAAKLRAANPDAVGPIPPDALTASGSGLDPDISPGYAAWQAPRVAAARGIPLATLEHLIAEHTHEAVLGFVGQDRVNVTTLNLALATMSQGQN